MKKVAITNLGDGIRLNGRIVQSPIGPQPFVTVTLINPDAEDVRLDFPATEFERFVAMCTAFIDAVSNGEVRLEPDPD